MSQVLDNTIVAVSEEGTWSEYTMYSLKQVCKELDEDIDEKCRALLPMRNYTSTIDFNNIERGVEGAVSNKHIATIQLYKKV